MFSGTKRIARAHRLSSYDASYLDLAERNDVPLATFDTRLRRAAASMRIPVL
jgi:predicted nucleic acid-binding protein